jgi:uncharacterized protein (TIGR03066 family)
MLWAAVLGRRPGGAARSSWGKESAMRWSRFALAGLLLFGLTLLATAGGDTAKNIIGKWEVVKTSDKDKGPPPGTTVQFAKDGKLKLHIEFMGKEFDIGGTYKIDGKKLHIEFKGEKVPPPETVLIKTLTKDRLVLEHTEEKRTVEFKRVKKKKG